MGTHTTAKKQRAPIAAIATAMLLAVDLLVAGVMLCSALAFADPLAAEALPFAPTAHVPFLQVARVLVFEQPIAA